jgi:hypothetical protein
VPPAGFETAETLIGIAAFHGHALDDIVRIASEKQSERGGFYERL